MNPCFAGVASVCVWPPLSVFRYFVFVHAAQALDRDTLHSYRRDDSAFVNFLEYPFIPAYRISIFNSLDKKDALTYTISSPVFLYSVI